jgi:FkbM family methyltransferase
VLKKLLKRGLLKAGFEVREVRRWKPQFGFDAYEDMVKLCTNKTSPVLFDVGANVGQTVDLFRRYFAKPVVHSFEPSRGTFTELRKNVGHLPDVYVNNFGLGSRREQRAFVENSETVMSSFLEPGPDGWGKVTDRPVMEVRTLDDYCADRGVGRVDVLKCDTQGYELEILRGSEAMFALDRVHLVYLEITFSEMYRGLPGLDEIYRYLIDRRFHLVSFYEIIHKADGRANWTDAMFINPRAVAGDSLSAMAEHDGPAVVRG